MNPAIKKGRWNYAEDVKFALLFDIFDRKWCKIANYYAGERSDIQLRERWCNLLDPNLKDIKWNGREDLLLL